MTNRIGYPAVMFPRWVTKPTDMANLREVGPNLFVGSKFAPRLGPNGGEPKRPQDWRLVVDLCGAEPELHQGVSKLIVAAFDDATPIPDGYLNDIALAVPEYRAKGPVLIQCAAGLSRSASVAYALLRFLDDLSHDEARARVQTPGVTDWPHPTVLGSARKWVRENR